MRIFLLLLACPLLSLAQYEPNEKLHFRSTVITDSGTIKGYFLFSSDSAVFISQQKTYAASAAIRIPVNSIKELNIKRRGGYRVWGVFGSAVIGFTLTAGLIENNDLDNNGKTSFFELVWGAIEGTTSKNRRRRNTALIAGGAGGTLFMLASILGNKNLSLVFPLNNRNNFYTGKRDLLYDFVKF